MSCVAAHQLCCYSRETYGWDPTCSW